MDLYDNAEALLRVLREPRRNNYFYGKRMDVQHFRMEQDYGKLKQWLLNRLTLGTGVLCGLRVSVSGGRVCVDPGVAIDGLGREIIVPVRCCVDPIVAEDPCCGAHRPALAPPPGPLPTFSPQPTRTPAPTPTAAGQPSGTPAGTVADGLFTLWLCYRECMTDHQPVLVSECGTRDECSPGTIVESFCLKFASGMAPPLGDPDWCASLWQGGRQRHELFDVPSAQEDAYRAALGGRRELLCELFDQDCDPADGDPCVPLALVEVKDGQPRIEACVVRPRIYSNQRLLDLILCLADKIDECCGHRTLRVRSIEFLHRSAAGPDTIVATMATPMQDTSVDLDAKANAIRIRFTKPLATNRHKPTTPGLNNPDYQVHNVQVLPANPGGALAYVPGSLALEQPDTLRFDLFPDSPWSRGPNGWREGQYQIVLRGTEDLAEHREALAAQDDDQPLDGERITPAGGAMSGDGSPGGDFIASFTVARAATPTPAPTAGPTPAPTPAGTPAPTPSQTPSPAPTPTATPPAGTPPPPPPKLMHVAKIEYLGFDEQVIGVVKRPDEAVDLNRDLAGIRVTFDHNFAAAGPRSPNVAGLQDPNWRSHNVQLRLAAAVADRVGTPYIAAKLAIEHLNVLRIDILRGTRLVNQNGRWLTNLRVDCELFLRGTPDAANGFAELADNDGNSLDGEPHPPAGGVISGDGKPGGDFSTKFAVFIAA